MNGMGEGHSQDAGRVQAQFLASGSVLATELSWFPFEVEHITPVSSGGSDDLANLALSCRSRNLYKASQQSGTVPDTQQQVRLFNPCEDRWDTPFQVEPESGEIEG